MIIIHKIKSKVSKKRSNDVYQMVTTTQLTGSTARCIAPTGQRNVANIYQ